MKENTDEKNLTKRENSLGIFGKIGAFFKNIFSKKQTTIITNNLDKVDEKIEFKNSVKIDSEVEADFELLELQRKVVSGEIKIEDLTDEQEDKLIDLYDKQIAVKKAKIDELKKKIEKLKKAS